MPAARLDSDAVEHAVIGALASFYRDQHDLIADAITAAQASHAAAQDGRRAELAATEHDLARTARAIDRYLAAFENGTLDPEDLADRLAQLKARSCQLRARRDELAGDVAAIPTAPPATALRRVADHVADIVASGSRTQRKTLIEAFIAQVKITGPTASSRSSAYRSRQQRIMHGFQAAWQPQAARPPKIRFTQ